MNKKIRKYLVAILLLSGVLCNADVTLEVTPVPNYSSQVYYYVSGNLTNAKSQMAYGDGGEGFFYYEWFISPSEYSLNPTECCTTKNENGKVWKVPQFSYKISSIHQIIYIPEWINRITCNTANQEWNRYWQDIFKHEYRHYTDYKSYLDNSSNYESVVTGLKLEIACSTKSGEDASSDINKMISDAGEQLNSKIAGGIEALSNAFHGENGAPNEFPMINLTNECH